LVALSRSGDKINPADYPFQGAGAARRTLEFDLFVHSGKTLFKKFPALQAAKFVNGHCYSPSFISDLSFIVTTPEIYVNDRQVSG
jgi:hypothetical protein